MRLILHGILRDLCGPEIPFMAKNVYEALEGFCTQVDGLPTGVMIEVVGYPSLESMKDSDQVDEVHLVPSMVGGGGKFTTILLGAIEIGLAFALPGIGIALSAGIHSALIVAGITTALMGVVQLLMPAPSNHKAADPPASKYLGLNQNTTALGTPQMLAYGRVRMAGQWISLLSQSNSIVHGNFPA